MLRKPTFTSLSFMVGPRSTAVLEVFMSVLAWESFFEETKADIEWPAISSIDRTPMFQPTQFGRVGTRLAWAGA